MLQMHDDLEAVCSIVRRCVEARPALGRVGMIDGLSREVGRAARFVLLGTGRTLPSSRFRVGLTCPSRGAGVLLPPCCCQVALSDKLKVQRSSAVETGMQRRWTHPMPL
jgi:hypothetical protein